MKTIQLFVSLICGSLITSAVNAQQYLNMRQDGRIYDVDVVVFARNLSQPNGDAISNKALVKDDDVVVLPFRTNDQELFQYPEVVERPNNSIPIDNQADPVRVLSDVILSTSMDHAIVNRLKVNPTYRPIYRQKWRQAPSAFLNPRYIEVSNLGQRNSINNNDLNPDGFSMQNQVADFSIDGQVAFSSQRYKHLHVKMNLFRVNASGEPLVYQLSQQKRIDLDQWQYFDHQQFGVLIKVTAIKLTQGE